jgi:AmiR/NasT family two-component response regulator
MTDVIDSLRDLTVAILCRRGSTGDELTQQVNRIGCPVESYWPVPETLPDKVNLLFAEVNDESQSELHSMLQRPRKVPLTLIAVISYENPSVLSAMQKIGAHAVVTKPLRAAGVLSAMVMARHQWAQQCRFSQSLEKLRNRLESLQKVNDAKFILMRHRNIDDKEAYLIIRKQAMSKRTTTIEIAQSIINADGILRDFKTD